MKLLILLTISVWLSLETSAQNVGTRVWGLFGKDHSSLRIERGRVLERSGREVRIKWDNCSNCNAWQKKENIFTSYSKASSVRRELDEAHTTLGEAVFEPIVEEAVSQGVNALGNYLCSEDVMDCAGTKSGKSVYVPNNTSTPRRAGKRTLKVSTSCSKGPIDVAFAYVDDNGQTVNRGWYKLSRSKPVSVTFDVTLETPVYYFAHYHGDWPWDYSWWNGSGRKIERLTVRQAHRIVGARNRSSLSGSGYSNIKARKFGAFDGSIKLTCN